MLDSRSTLSALSHQGQAKGDHPHQRSAKKQDSNGSASASTQHSSTQIIDQPTDKASWKDEVKKHMGISTSESNKLQTYLQSVGFNLIDEVLGIGGGGVVLLGKEQSGQQEEVAIKILHADNSCLKTRNWEEYLNSRKVAQDTKSIWKEFSKHVLPVKQLLHFSTGFHHLSFIVTTRCKTDLKQFLKTNLSNGGRLPMEVVHSICLQITRGLLATHANHILHLDIKPANLLLSQELVWKITDLGASKSLKPAADHTVNLKGMTAQYASPEQYQHFVLENHSLHITVASDIYSLGVVFIELTGIQVKVPWLLQMKLRDFSNEQEKNQIFSSNLNSRYGALNSLIKQMLRYQPDKRISLGKVEKALSAIVEQGQNSVEQQGSQVKQFTPLNIQAQMNTINPRLSSISNVFNNPLRSNMNTSQGNIIQNSAKSPLKQRVTGRVPQTVNTEVPGAAVPTVAASNQSSSPEKKPAILNKIDAQNKNTSNIFLESNNQLSPLRKSVSSSGFVLLKDRNVQMKIIPSGNYLSKTNSSRNYSPEKNSTSTGGSSPNKKRIGLGYFTDQWIRNENIPQRDMSNCDSQNLKQQAPVAESKNEVDLASQLQIKRQNHNATAVGKKNEVIMSFSNSKQKPEFFIQKKRSSLVSNNQFETAIDLYRTQGRLRRTGSQEHLQLAQEQPQSSLILSQSQEKLQNTPSIKKIFRKSTRHHSQVSQQQQQSSQQQQQEWQQQQQQQQQCASSSLLYNIHDNLSLNTSQDEKLLKQIYFKPSTRRLATSNPKLIIEQTKQQFYVTPYQQKQHLPQNTTNHHTNSPRKETKADNNNKGYYGVGCWSIIAAQQSQQKQLQQCSLTSRSSILRTSLVKRMNSAVHSIDTDE